MTALRQHVENSHHPAPDRKGSFRARIAYQPALDGVRAVAVTMVLFFHGGVRWMRGGYFGVSVFFTLSGFLITSLLFNEFESTNRIAPGAFYVRRAKRLLPASLVCLSAVSLLAMSNAWTEANHLKRDLFGALAQMANWVRLFAGESYVDVQTRTAGLRSPLDHYWSLAIEEQFYWLWPVAFWALARAARRRGVSLTSVVGFCTIGFAACAPLVAAVWGGDAAYWATPARAGEILLGAFIAVVVAERRFTPAAWMAAVGLGAVLVLGVFLPSASGPAYRGAFPVLALASASLLLGLQRPGPVARLLSWRPFVALGRVSYGVYLYHLPIFVYVTSERSGLHGWSLLALQIALTLAFATGSYWLIERPIRRATWAGVRTSVVALGASLGVAMLAVAVPSAAGSYWGVSASARARVAIPVVRSVAPLTAEPVVIRSSPGAALVEQDVTTPPPLSRPVRILVVGDSTAEATGHGLVEWAAANPAIAQVSLAISGGCGFVRGGVVASDGKIPFQTNCDTLLDNDLPRDLRDLQPDVVMMLVWARDQAPRRWSEAEGELTPHDPRFLMRLINDYRAITNEVVAATTGRIVWVRPPKGDNYWMNTKSPFTDESAHIIVEGVIDQVVNEFEPRATFLDLRSWMESDGIAFDHAARPDGLHLTTAAATDVATRWLGPQLVLAATTPTGGASAP